MASGPAAAAAAAAPPPPSPPPDLKAFAQRLGLDWDAPLAADGAPELDAADDERLACSCGGVELALGDDGASAGVGTLHITTRRVVWVAGNSSGSSGGAANGTTAAATAAARSLSCTYRQIAMHAVSRDTSAFARPCVYVQLDEGSEEPGGGMSDDGDEGEEEEDEPPTAELRFVPAQEAQVDELFAKLCECSALNPDSDLEDEAGARLFFDEEEALRGLPAEQRAALLAARAEGALALGEEEEEEDEGEAEGEEEGGEGQRARRRQQRYSEADGVDQLMADDPGRFENDDDDDDDDDEEAAAAAAGNGLAR